MPSTTNTGRKPVRKPQPRRTNAEQKPEAAKPSVPTPDAGANALFDEGGPTPPAAETAQLGEAPAAGRPEGTNSEQVEGPAAPAAFAPVVPVAADTGGEAPKAESPSSGEPVSVRLGQAKGLLHRMPLGLVLTYADAFAEKIDALTYSSAVQDLQGRMRASEGRCAPIYFTMDDDGDPEHLLAGDDALSAAKAAGIETVSVVLIHPGDAGAVHAYLNQQAGTAGVSTEDDELVWRAHNDAS